MRARLVVALAVVFVWIVSAFIGAAGYRLAQWWAPAGWIGLVGIVGFVVWQTHVTMRLQALLRRVDAERRHMERLKRRLITEPSGRHLP
jgi:hypothetical protein